MRYFLRNSVKREVLGIISAGGREGGDDRRRGPTQTSYDLSQTQARTVLLSSTGGRITLHC